MHRRLRRSDGLERGQVLVMVSLLLPILLGFAALAIDLGTYTAQRRTLQNYADSIALAAGHGLPDEAAAQALASQWAAKNNVAISDYDVDVTTTGSTPTVRVTLTKAHQFAFIRLLGISEANVGAVAAAQKLAPATGAGIVPWAITEETADGAASGSVVTIKYDSHGGYGQGNFGAIRIDGNGASDYEESAKYGAESQVCSSQEPNCDPADCPGTYPTTCGEDAPECDGYECAPKTGNMTGPTRDAVDFRVDNTSDGCDTFDEAFTALSVSSEEALLDKYVVGIEGAGGAPNRAGSIRVPAHHGSGSHPTYTPTATRTPTHTATPSQTPTRTSTPTATPTYSAAGTATAGAGSATAAASVTATNTGTPAPTSTPGSGGGPTYGLTPDCNPWSGGACPPAPSSASCSRRIFLIPIVREFGNGSSDPVEIVGFALVFLEDYDGSCSGSSCDIEARFVRADVTTGAYSGAYDPNSALQFVKLTE